MSDDLISRQAAIDALKAKKDKSAKGDIGCFYNTIIQNTIDAIKDLPSAQPEQKTGQWISNRHTDTVLCSECKKCYGDESKFCPNCGTEMRERVNNE